MQRKKKPYVWFIMPGFLVYTLFVIIPIIFVLFISLFDWSGIGPMKFIGLGNFEKLFTDARISPTFFNALKNNLKYLLCVWFIITPIQFIMAYLLYLKVPFHKYHKFMIFMPYVISSTIISFFATIIFDPNIGFMNKFFTSIGLEQFKSSWFGDPNLAFKLLIFLVLWQGAGTGMMIFYANMQDIPTDVVESSRIDGCSELQRLTHIILPLSIPSCASTIIMSTIWALGIFDLPYILGGASGGVKNCMDFVSLVFYRYTFGSALNGKSNMGFGASISTVMFLVILAVTIVQNKILNKISYEY